MFQVRIHCIDYCLAPPTEADHAASRAPIPKITSAGNHNGHSERNERDNEHQSDKEVRVPIIRIFGATGTGQVACAHIHGVFPYLYVSYEEFRFSDSDRIIAALRNGIDQALGRTTVLAITLVRGVPFYGFYVGFRLYLKIYLLDPSLVTRAAETLRQGRIAGIPRLQPHESHIPFLLQFMTDYNLYGCDTLNATEAFLRTSGVSEGSCPVEVDIFAHSISNRRAVPERWQHENLPEVPTDPSQRLVYSMAALWREMAAKYNKKGKKNAEERKIWEMISTQDAFAQLGASSSDPRRTPAPWLHEDEYRQQIADIIASERLRESRPARPRDPLEDQLPTIRQSVEDFYPPKARSEGEKRKRKRVGDGEENALSADLALDEIPPGATDANESEKRKGSLPPAATVKLSPSPNFEHQLGVLLEKHDKGVGGMSFNNDWLRSQQSEPRRSQELPTKKRQQLSQKETHRPLSQTFSVVKSAFPREDERKSSQTVADGGKDGASKVDSEVDGPVVPSTSDRQPKQRSILRRGDKDRRVEQDGLAIPSALKKSNAKRQPIARKKSQRVQDFGSLYRVSEKVLVISKRPPTAKAVMATLAKVGPEEIHQGAFFSEEADIQDDNWDQAGIGKTASFLPKFAPLVGSRAGSQQHQQLNTEVWQQPTARTWEVATLPPSYARVHVWLENEAKEESIAKKRETETLSTTQQRVSNACLSQKERAALLPKKPAVALDMRTLCLEVHANSRGAFLPNPERDAIQCVFWGVNNGNGIGSDADVEHPSAKDKGAGVISVSRPLRDDFSVEVVPDERELLRRVVRLVHTFDPDILAGYEIFASSWGYLSERASLYDIDLWQELSRVSQPRVVPFYERGQDVTGRYMLSIGLAMRAEVDLRQYTLESAAWHILGHRVPFYRSQVLTAWFSSGRPRDLSRLIRYYRRRTSIDLALIDSTELVPRTSEQARILGIDFASVLDRGSQFKVESVMLRVAKPENFVMPSPNHEQVGQQNAAECTPLVLEPRSAFYSSPVVVLDFTSLYPSLMIAYNFCYSTFVGRLDPLYHEKKLEATQKDKEKQHQRVHGPAKGGTNKATTNNATDLNNDDTAALIAKYVETTANKMGFTTYERPPGLLEQLAQLGIVVAPTGMMYVGAKTRQSLLAKMLAEILDTRVMVKAAMKKTAANKLADRQRLHNRQLALKLLANVTYGYTSASFSGRMPCVEVADSIVQTGRQTLDRAIALIHSVRRWNAEVVYGDTDSLFVHLPGRTREQAFRIGAEMAEAVTASNPHPVRLKFEKVYHPCVLLAKKRYVGYEFDTPDQVEPIFDAKGIETVRRDGSPASAKVLEECLRILFDSADLSRVKAYVQARFDDVIHDRLSIADLCFAKDVRQPGSYKAPPPGAIVASRRMAQDPRAVLLPGERVPYVVVAGPPGTPLRDRCVPPEEVVKNRHLRIDSDYYIQNSLIPPLDRIFRLVNVEVLRWYLEMPRARMPLRIADPAPTQQGPAGYIGQQTLDVWLRGSRCARCDQPVRRKRRRWPELNDGVLTVTGADEVDAADGDSDDFSGNDNDCDLGTGSEMDSPLGPVGQQRVSEKTPVLCKSCAKDNRGTLLYLQSRVRDAEMTYREALQACRSCARLGPRDEVRCENLTCPVYFVRTERAVQARVERSKVPLMDILAQRGMQDLEW